MLCSMVSAHFRLQLLKQRPIDVVISFSQASNLLSLALDALRRKGDGVHKKNVGRIWILWVKIPSGYVKIAIENDHL